MEGLQSPGGYVLIDVREVLKLDGIRHLVALASHQLDVKLHFIYR